ncbi:MAG: RnfH family protein [Buchnera aphidicola (Kaburagia rhusicola ensigallis)]
MKLIKIKIVYALKHKQFIKEMKLKNKISIKEAILTSNIFDKKVVDITKNNIGIYGNIVNLKDLVKNGDRIEIYRPLLIDPKELRRKKMLLKK